MQVCVPRPRPQAVGQHDELLASERHDRAGGRRGASVAGARHFFRHFGEMFLAMMVGMMALGALDSGILSAAGTTVELGTSVIRANPTISSGETPKLDRARKPKRRRG